MAVALHVFWQIFLEMFVEQSSIPNIILYKFVILICCHGNWSAKMLN